MSSTSAASPGEVNGGSSLSQAVLGYFRSFRVLRETGREYWGIQIVNFLDCAAYFALLDIASVFLSHDIGLSDKTAGYSLSLYTVATTVFLFFAGTLTDWLGIRVSTQISLLAQGSLRLALAVVGLVPSLPHRGWIATGLLFAMAPFMAMLQTVFQAANKRYTTERSRSAGYSLWYLFMNVGAASGGFLVDGVRKLMGWPNAHILSAGAILAVLCSLAAFLLVRNEEQLPTPGSDPVVADAPVTAPRRTPWQNAVAVLRDRTLWRLLALIALILGVRAAFVYLHLIMPKYWLRTIGPDAAIGTLQAINPVMIVVGLVLFVPLVNKFAVFSMLVYGALISAGSLLPLSLPWWWVSSDMAHAHYVMSFAALLLLSVGEVVWSPKLYEYTAAVAPPGQEGTYLGLSMLPWFLAKTVVSVLSGYLLVRWCPEGIGPALARREVPYWNSPAAMWLVLSTWAVGGCLGALALRSWFSRGVRPRHA